MNIYDFKANDIDGEEVDFKQFRGKVLLIANTASKCGFTPQYADLEKVYEKYKDDGLVILGFPSNQFNEQEPGNSEEIKKFCLINYGVTFPLFEKIEVRGENANPIFKYLTEQAPYKGMDHNHHIGSILLKMFTKTQPDYYKDNQIKWNFTKFLVDRKGNVMYRFEPTATPMDMIEKIESLMVPELV